MPTEQRATACVCASVRARIERTTTDEVESVVRLSVCLFVRSSREVVSYSAGCSFDLF